MPSVKELIPTYDDANAYIIKKLKEHTESIEYNPERGHNYGQRGMASYGYDIWLTNLVSAYLSDTHGIRYHDSAIYSRLDPIFADALSDIARRGILRSGTFYSNGQGTSMGVGYSLTERGYRWIQQLDESSLIISPGRLGGMLAKYKDSFHISFLHRSQEAVICYNANAYLACCVMCGASFESILRTLYSKLKGVSYEETLRKNTDELKNEVLVDEKERVKKAFEAAFGLTWLWRNESAHPDDSKIDEQEASISLSELMKFTQFVVKNWKDHFRERNAPN